MKKLLVASLLTLLPFTAHAEMSDKNKHLGASMVISTGAYFLDQNIQKQFSDSFSPGHAERFAFSSCIAIGAMKEVADSMTHSAEMGDLAADVIGCSIGTVFATSISKGFFISPQYKNHDDDSRDYYGISVSKSF